MSLGDTHAGLYATIGALLALLQRERGRRAGGPETVDGALYEAVVSVLEDLVPERHGYGVVRRRSGASLPGIVPSSTCPCRGDRWVVVGGNGDASCRRLMLAIGRPDLADDPALAGNAGRVAQRERIDAAIAAWTAQRTPTGSPPSWRPPPYPSGRSTTRLLADQGHGALARPGRASARRRL